MEQNNKTKIFEEYSIPKAFISLAIPTIISQIIMIIYNYADTWFLGQTKDENAVAALSVIMPVFIIMNAVASLFGIGGSSLIARYLGRKDPDKAKHVFAFSLWGSVAASIIYSLVILIFAKPIIYAVGGSDVTYEYIYNYALITMIIGSIPTILNNVFGHLVRAVGASKEASIGMGLGGVLNIILDPLFMFVLLPKGNEVLGAGLATMFSNVAATIFFIIYILKHKEITVFTLNPKDISFKHSIPKEVLFIGFPAALSTTLAMVSNIFANTLVKGAVSVELQSPSLAGLGVAKKINTLAFNICMGITQGMLPFIAYNFAAKNLKRMKKGIAFMFVTAIGFSLVAITIFQIFTRQLVAFFVPGQENVIRYGVKFLHIIEVAVPLCSISFATNTVFQATGKKVSSFILSILRKGLLDIPLMFILVDAIGEFGVLWATPIAESLSVFVALGLLLSFLVKESKKHKNELNLEIQ